MSNPQKIAQVPSNANGQIKVQDIINVRQTSKIRPSEQQNKQVIEKPKILKSAQLVIR